MMEKTEMNNTELVKCAQLDMLIELKRICEKNKIPYFLVGGTLIGAIRHNGFIPWDDDIDVGMLRKDYEKFIEVCATELNEEYVLHDWHIDPNSPLPFLKMKIKGTHYRERLSQNSEMSDEIFIDIFPFENAPNTAYQRAMHSVFREPLKKILLLRCGFEIDRDGGLMKKCAYKLLRFISKVKSLESWKDCFARMAQRYNDKETDYVVGFSGAYSYKKECKPREMMQRLGLHTFEGVEVNVPQDYDEYLRQIYGDYMKLPPESEQQGRHGILYVDMGRYVVKSKMVEGRK